MLTVITFFWRLCTLRAHAGQVPTAAVFVGLVALADIGISILLSSQWSPAADPLRLATSITAQQATIACLVWAGLYFRNLDRRFAGTITAIFGCDLLLMTLLGAMTPVALDVSDSLRQSLLFVFFVWSLAIVGHILHQALEIRFMFGVATAFAITLLSGIIGNVVLE